MTSPVFIFSYLSTKIYVEVHIGNVSDGHMYSWRYKKNINHSWLNKLCAVSGAVMNSRLLSIGLTRLCRENSSISAVLTGPFPTQGLSG